MTFFYVVQVDLSQRSREWRILLHVVLHHTFLLRSVFHMPQDLRRVLLASETWSTYKAVMLFLIKLRSWFTHREPESMDPLSSELLLENDRLKDQVTATV